MIQSIAPRRLDNAYVPFTPGPDDLVLDVSDQGLLLHADRHLPLLGVWRERFSGSAATLRYAFRFTLETVPEGLPDPPVPGAAQAAAHPSAEALRKGTDDPERPEDAGDPLLRPEARLFLVLRPAGEEATVPEGMQRIRPSELRGVPGPLPLAAFTALHLFRWYDTHRFCGRCGSALRHAPHERALICPACGNTCYPVIAPCVIVAVTHGDRLLLTRYAGSRAGHFVLVAGFTEIGETSEQAAAREVMEETGLKIRHLRYAGSQPWGLSGTLATGFFAELDGSEEIRLDTDELSDARWVRRADIPPCPDTASLTMTMIARFARGEV